MIDQQLCNDLHEQLLAERQQLEDEIAGLSGGRTSAETFQDDEMTDVVGQHPADEGSELFEREKNMTLQRNAEASLQQVNDALKKFENGTYGLCEECGKPIGEKRLRALPEATLCIEDQAKLEKRQNQAAAR